MRVGSENLVVGVRASSMAGSSRRTPAVGRVVLELMVTRWLIPAAVLLCGCPGDRTTLRTESTRASCAVGERPGYFVPGGDNGPLALLGCARLGLSDKRVEFSGSVAELDGEHHACVNPAYSGRGQRGFFIPTICALEPALSRFAVRDARRPRQGVRGYRYVIWGTAGTATDVVARFAGGSAHAVVFTVEPDVAATLGASPFSLFVMELPLSAACSSVTVVARDPRATERVPPRADVCRRRSPGGTAAGAGGVPGLQRLCTTGSRRADAPRRGLTPYCSEVK
jgi:hypothetical protein